MCDAISITTRPYTTFTSQFTAQNWIEAPGPTLTAILERSIRPSHRRHLARITSIASLGISRSEVLLMDSIVLQ